MDRNSCLVVGESVSGIEIVLRNLCNFFMLYYIVNFKKAKQKTNKQTKMAKSPGSVFMFPDTGLIL